MEVAIDPVEAVEVLCWGSDSKETLCHKMFRQLRTPKSISFAFVLLKPLPFLESLRLHAL
eukprot:5507758-Amphidinium_carterae.1